MTSDGRGKSEVSVALAGLRRLGNLPSASLCILDTQGTTSRKKPQQQTTKSLASPAINLYKNVREIYGLAKIVVVIVVTFIIMRIFIVCIDSPLVNIIFIVVCFWKQPKIFSDTTYVSVRACVCFGQKKKYKNCEKTHPTNVSNSWRLCVDALTSDWCSSHAGCLFLYFIEIAALTVGWLPSDPCALAPHPVVAADPLPCSLQENGLKNRHREIAIHFTTSSLKLKITEKGLRGFLLLLFVPCMKTLSRNSEQIS